MGAWPLVGRDEELRLLHDVVVGQGRSLVVAGPAGVGKSRLVSEFLATLSSSGYRTEAVRATTATATIPFGPFARWLPVDAAPLPSRLHLLQTAARALTRDGGPLVVGIDDAHLLDDGSVALAQHLAEVESVSVVLTVRSDEALSEAITAFWKDELAERIDVDALSEPDVGDLLERSLAGPVATGTTRRVWRLTSGRPLYVREVVRAAIGNGVLQQRNGEWVWRGELPGTGRLTDLLRVRLDAVGSDVREVVERVALGEPLPLEFLTARLDRHAIVSAEQSGLVAFDREGEATTVRLAHPLYGEVLRTTLPPLVAQQHFRDLATVGQAAGWNESEPLRIATWLLEGGGVPEDGSVFEVAAKRALASRDARLADRLARLAVDSGAGAGASLTRAAALIPLERWDDAEVVLRQLLDDPADELTSVHAARMQSLVLFHGRGEPVRARAVLTAASNRMSEPYRSWLRAQEASLASFAGEPVVGALLAELALAEADALPVRVQALWSASLAWVIQGRAHAALGAAQTCLPFMHAAFDDDPMVSVMGPVYALALALDGRFDDAAAYADDFLERAMTRHVPAYWAMPQTVSAYVALAQGRLARARRLADAAIVSYREDNAFGGGDWCGATLVSALAQAGEVDSAAAVLEWVRSHAFIPRIYRFDLERAAAWLDAARGEVSAGRARALAVADDAATTEASVPELLALLEVVRLGGAGAVASRLRKLTSVVEGAHAAAIASYATALADGDGIGLDAAAARFEAMGNRLLAAEASAEAARAHGEAGLSGSRLTSLARARILAAGCEGARTPALRDLDAHPGLATLTAREREAVELASRGLTNREIATRLFLSVRTVHTHLQRAYAKLGVNDRGQLADLVAASPEPGSAPGY
jgi:DNA-binding CsgD family transcriptional regulator